MPDPPSSLARDRRGWAWWADVFAAHRSPAYAAIARACAFDPGIADPGIAGPVRPLVVLAAVRRAALQGRATDPFGGDVDAFRADVRALSGEVAEACARDLVQFTEPLRMADVLPGLALVAARAPGRPLRIVELGSCAGLLLVPERYEIRYPTGTWAPAAEFPAAADRVGAAPVALASDLAVPPALIERELPIESRVGIDLAPVDPAAPQSLDRLRSFAWAGDPAREDRLRAALAAVAADPPTVVRGDVIELLPDLLVERVGPDATTVVIDSCLSNHLTGRQALALGRLLDRFAARGSLALVSRSGRGGAGDPLPAGIGVVHLTARWRVAYARTDLLSERTRWVADVTGAPPRAAAW